jgi:phosphoglycolate phosphatase
MTRHLAVLFDLDGTLADTAPDLAAALNALLAADGRNALPFEQIRPWVSWGAVRMIELGYGAQPDAAHMARLRARFLSHYEAGLCRQTRLFPGMHEVLEELESGQVQWGIVTNKPGWLTEPLLAALGLAERAATVICGDTVPYAKPHPLPLLHAARELGIAPARCVYVGDNASDIVAGRAAGMRTAVAAWGYIPAGDDPVLWQADRLLEAPAALGPYVSELNLQPGVA